MAKNKDQHYVPKMLMKRFADENHLFSFAVKKGTVIKTILNKPYDKQCQYDYYYGRDCEWEKTLGELESKCSIIFDKIEKDKNYYPTFDEITDIKSFFVAQRTRTPRMIEWELSQIRTAYIEGFRMFKQHESYEPITKHEMELIKTKDPEFEEQAKQIMRDMFFTKELISDLELIIVHFECFNELVLSDDPVIVVNPFIHSAGLVSIGLIMLMPIGRHTMLVLRDPILYEPINRIVRSNRSKAINCINRYQTITFDKTLMFSNCVSKDYVEETIEKTCVDRKRYAMTGMGGVFPGTNDTFIVSHHPTLLPNYSYVFSSIKKEYRKFKFFDHINYRFTSSLYLDRIEKTMPVFAMVKGSNFKGKNLKQYKEFIVEYWKHHKKFESIDFDFDQKYKRNSKDNEM